MNQIQEELTQRYDHALAIAKEAGDLVMEYFRRDGVDVERKGDNSPVTIADRQAEEHLRKRIAERFPDDTIVGEEYDPQQGSSDYRWIVDPIDGTKAFICGVPFFGTLVGVEHQGEPVIGIIHLPALEETVHALRGGGAWHEYEGKRVEARVLPEAKLEDGLLTTTDAGSFGRRDAMPLFHQLDQAAWFTRTWGDCYAYVLVATGRAVAAIDPFLCLWDAAALLPVLQEAGGCFTDWQGNPTTAGGDGIGACPAAHQQIVALSKQYPALSDSPGEMPTP